MPERRKKERGGIRDCGYRKPGAIGISAVKNRDAAVDFTHIYDMVKPLYCQ